MIFGRKGNTNMNIVKHSVLEGNSRQRYIIPATKEIYVEAQWLLCLSPGNDSMREYDCGDGGFSREY